MSDNVQVTGVSPNPITVATDDVGGVQHQTVKVEYGLDGAATRVSTSNPLPVVDTAVAGYVDGLETLLAGRLTVGDATNAVSVSTSEADSVSNTANRLAVGANLKGYNGTTWDRIKTGFTGVVSTVVGYINVIPIGRYNAAPPVLTDGQYINPQVDSAGNLKTTSATLSAGENLTFNRLHTLPTYSFTNITSATTTTVKSGAGFLGGICINTTAAGTITVYDNTAGSGTKIGILKASIGEGTYLRDITFSTGLTLVTGAASDITVTYL